MILDSINNDLNRVIKKPVYIELKVSPKLSLEENVKTIKNKIKFRVINDEIILCLMIIA